MRALALVLLAAACHREPPVVSAPVVVDLPPVPASAEESVEGARGVLDALGAPADAGCPR